MIINQIHPPHSNYIDNDLNWSVGSEDGYMQKYVPVMLVVSHSFHQPPAGFSLVQDLACTISDSKIGVDIQAQLLYRIENGRAGKATVHCTTHCHKNVSVLLLSMMKWLADRGGGNDDDHDPSKNNEEDKAKRGRSPTCCSLSSILVSSISGSNLGIPAFTRGLSGSI